MAIPVFKPSIKRKDMDAVLTCLISDQLGPGTESEKLVLSILETLDLEGGVVLRERTRGLEVLLHCLDLAPGARIAVSALSPSSYEFAIRHEEFTPVFIDTEGSLPVMSLEALKQSHDAEQLDAVILEHHLGYSPDMEALAAMEIPVIQDISNVMSFEKTVTYVGDYLLVSLEPDGIATCGGGVFIGAVNRKSSRQLTSVIDTYPEDIYLPDMNSALGAIQVKDLKNYVEQRMELVHLLQQNIMQGKHKLLSGEEQGAPTSLPVILNSPMSDVIQYAVKKQVELIPAFNNSIISRQMRVFDSGKDVPESPAEQFPNASGFAMRTILTPLYPSLGKKEVELLIKVLKTLP